MADVEEAVEWWPVKLKLLEANYEKSKLKIRQNSLYCRLSIIQLQNALDEEKFITQKYEQRAVAERLVFAEEQVEKHAKEKEALSKNAKDILKKSEEEWKGKTNDLFKKIASLEGEKQKESEMRQSLIQKISNELDVLKGQENEWKIENSKLSLKVKTMEKKFENVSDILGKQKIDKAIQVVIVDEQIDNNENIAVKTKPPSSRPANPILCEQNRQVLRKSKRVQQTTPLHDANNRKPFVENQNEKEKTTPSHDTNNRKPFAENQNEKEKTTPSHDTNNRKPVAENQNEKEQTTPSHDTNNRKPFAENQNEKEKTTPSHDTNNRKPFAENQNEKEQTTPSHDTNNRKPVAENQNEKEKTTPLHNTTNNRKPFAENQNEKEKTTPLHNTTNNRKPFAENQNEKENVDDGEDNDHATSQTNISLPADNQQLEDSSFLKETANILKSCRKRSVLKRNESKLDDNAVFLANIDSEATDTKRSRKDVKKRQRRVTFSDELDIKSFNTSQEQKETEAVGGESEKDLVSHKDEPTPCNDLEPTNKASKVVSDALSVKTRNGGRLGVRNLRPLGKQPSRQEHGSDSGCVNKDDQVSLAVKGVKTSKGKKRRPRKRLVPGNAPSYAVESVSQVHESNDNCTIEDDEVKCGGKTTRKRGRKGNLPKITKEEQGNEDKVKTKRKMAAKGKPSPDYDILLSDVRRQQEGTEQNVAGKEKGNKMKNRVEGKVHSVVDPTSLYQEEISNSENGRAGETAERCGGSKRSKRGLREQAFNSGGIRPSKRLVNMFASESICQEGHCSGINTQHGAIKATRAEADATLSRAIDGKKSVVNKTRGCVGGGKVKMTRSRKGKRKVNEKTLKGTQTEDKIHECVETVKTGTDERTVAQNGNFTRNEVSENVKDCDSSEGVGDEIVTRKRAAKRSMAEVNVGNTQEKDEQEATETKEKLKKRNNGKTNVAPKTRSKKKDTALRSEPKVEDEETGVEEEEKRGKAPTRSRKAKSEMQAIYNETEDKCPQDANKILTVVKDNPSKKKDAALTSEPKKGDEGKRRKATTGSRKAKKEMVVSHDENKDKCPQEINENEIKETVVQEKDETIAVVEDNHSKKKDAAALRDESKVEDEEKRGKAMTRSRKDGNEETDETIAVVEDSQSTKIGNVFDDEAKSIDNNVEENKEIVTRRSKKKMVELNDGTDGEEKDKMKKISEKEKGRKVPSLVQTHVASNESALGSETKDEGEEGISKTVERMEIKEVKGKEMKENEKQVGSNDEAVLETEMNDEEKEGKEEVNETVEGGEMKENEKQTEEHSGYNDEAALETEAKDESEERIAKTVERRRMKEGKGIKEVIGNKMKGVRVNEVKEKLPTDCDDVIDNDEGQEKEQVKKANKSGMKKKMAEISNEIKENYETERKEVAKRTGEGWALRNNNGANKDGEECSQKPLSELQNNVGTTNVVSGQQTICTAVDSQAKVNVSKPVKKKRRTLYSTRDSMMMNTTDAIFQETLPLNHTRSNGNASIPPSLSAFMKAFIVPKLKK